MMEEYDSKNNVLFILPSKEGCSMTVQVKVTSPGQTNPPSSTEEVKITQPVTVHRSENIIVPTIASAMYPVDNLNLISEILLAI